MNEDEKKVQEELEETTETAVEETVETTEEAVEVEQEEQAPEWFFLIPFHQLKFHLRSLNYDIYKA